MAINVSDNGKLFIRFSVLAYIPLKYFDKNITLLQLFLIFSGTRAQYLHLFDKNSTVENYYNELRKTE